MIWSSREGNQWYRRIWNNWKTQFLYRGDRKAECTDLELGASRNCLWWQRKEEDHKLRLGRCNFEKRKGNAADFENLKAYWPIKGILVGLLLCAEHCLEVHGPWMKAIQYNCVFFQVITSCLRRERDLIKVGTLPGEYRMEERSTCQGVILVMEFGI